MLGYCVHLTATPKAHRVLRFSRPLLTQQAECNLPVNRTPRARVQVAYNEQKARLEAQGKRGELALANDQEAAYQARVAAAGAHTPPSHFGRPKVQWFY